MKFTKYLLLIIGVLALFAAGYGLYNGSEVTDQLLGIVCGLSLIWGYFTIDRMNQNAK